MTFQLDTSGSVEMPSGIMFGPSSYRWRDLSPFAQGYVEALLTAGICWPDPAEGYGPSSSVVRFSDLHPETLAAILKDCEAAQARFHLATHLDGVAIWKCRQIDQVPGFPPLAIDIDSDGKVRLRATDPEVRAMKPGSAPATDEKSNLPREGE